MSKPKPGDVAPDFSLATDKGDSFSLSAHRGRPVVVFFYPHDDTQTCTIENKAFSALSSAFEASGAVLIGVSPDSVAQHCKFRDKYGLETILGADPDHQAIGAYGVWGQKTRFGRTYDGVNRTTFLIDAQGRIAAVWDVARVKGHADQVLAAIKALPKA